MWRRCPPSPTDSSLRGHSPSSSFSKASSWRLRDTLRCRARGIHRNNTRQQEPENQDRQKGDGQTMSLQGTGTCLIRPARIEMASPQINDRHHDGQRQATLTRHLGVELRDTTPQVIPKRVAKVPFARLPRAGGAQTPRPPGEGGGHADDANDVIPHDHSGRKRPMADGGRSGWRKTAPPWSRSRRSRRTGTVSPCAAVSRASPVPAAAPDEAGSGPRQRAATSPASARPSSNRRDS